MIFYFREIGVKMANNTRFKALQTEAMSRLMGTLMTNDQSLDQLTKKGLDFMKYSTELRKGFYPH